MDKFVTRFLKTFCSGVILFVQCIFVLFGVCASSMIIYPYVKEGVAYSIEQFTQFFADNSSNYVANWFGTLFNRAVEYLTPYPWVYVAVVLLGLFACIRGIRAGKRFFSNMEGLFETANNPASTNTNLRGTLIPANNRGAMARAGRKIGFGETMTSEPLVSRTLSSDADRTKIAKIRK